jgi:exodeoxyribonuclease VIII
MEKKGIYQNISNEDYHRGPGLSASGLKLLAQSPAHYKYSVHETTPAMLKGTATHCAVFEPERFEEEYIVAPELDRRTKAGKEAWAGLEASGKNVLSAEDYTDILGMTKAIRRHSIAGELVSAGVAEQSIYWDYTAIIAEDISFTFTCKARPDYIKPLSNGYLLVDLKTTQDARDFERSSYSFGYHLQAAHYLHGFNATECGPARGFVFIAVEKTPPYGVIVYEASQEFLNRGNDEIYRLYSLYAQCSNQNTWPNYDETVRTLNLPRWAA